MSEQDYKEQSVAYHGISEAKYAVRSDANIPGVKVVPFMYSKSISFDPAMEQQPLYFNNLKVMNIIKDQGYTGAIGTSAQDRAFEIELGHIMEVAMGNADVNINSLKRFDFYYEYNEKTASGLNYVVKVWALNIEAVKSAKAHSTDTNANTIGEYSYPITVYGDKIKEPTADKIYRDTNGNEITATRVISVPSDTGYATFGDTVPVVKMPAPPKKA